MSKLTSFTSASDALIQPSGATAGQTLTWNATSGQFEPANPSTSGLKVWTASTAYVAGELVVFAFGGVNTILRRLSVGTSGLTLDTAELAAWEYVSQASTLGFMASTLVPKGFKIAVTAGNCYESISNRTTGTIFNAGEQTNWTGLSEPECRPWAANTFYVGGDMVFQPIFGIATYIRRISIGTSGAAFDNAEAGTWSYVSQAGIPITFLANTFVFDRFLASFDGVLYYSNGARITGTSFDAAEQANWVALTGTVPATNSITSAMLLDGTIQTIDIADQAVTGNKIAAGTITFDNIADGTIIGSKLQNGGITAAKMGVNSVASSNIIDGTIQNEDIGAGQIGLDKLAPIPTTSLVGLGVGGSPAAPTNITLGTNLSFSGNVLNAVGGGGDSPEFPNWLPSTDYLAGDTVMMSSVTWGSWYMRRNAPGTSGSVLDTTELGQWVYVGQAQTFNWQPNQLVPQGLKIVEGGRYWERLASGTTQPAGLGFDTTEQANWQALTPALPAPLPIFNNNQVLRGNGSNVPVTDGRITFDIAAGAVDVSATGSGNLTLGSGSTGNINIGSNSTTRLTNLNGIVKIPNYARLTVANAANQALASNTISPVVFGGGNNIVGSGISQPTTSTFAVTRIGLYRIDLNLSIQSATANTRGIVSVTAGTATLTNQPLGMLTKAIRLRAANTAEEITWSLFLPITVVGTFSVSVTMLAASQINNYNGATGTAATTNISILEMA